MKLLDLLPEIVSGIMELIVLSGDLDIALYLRLVCKKFDDEILLAICSTRILDQLTRNRIEYQNEIPWRNERLFIQYLTTRTLADKYHKEEYSLFLKETLDWILGKRPEETGRREEYLRTLCECAVRSYPSWFRFRLNPGVWKHSKRVIDHFLAATACLGLATLFRDCLENGAEDAITFFGNTIEIVAGKGDLEMTTLLLQQGFAHPLARMGALRTAALNGHVAVAELILNTPDPQFRISEDPLWQRYAYVLEYAARGGQLEACRYLTEKIASITTHDDRPGLYIRYSCYKEDLEYLEKPVIAFWYDVVLYGASSWGQEPLCRWALDNGADPNTPIRSLYSIQGTAVEGSVMFGYHRVVRLLLERGAQIVEDKWTSGGRAFLRAVREGWLEVAQITIDNGYDVNLKRGPSAKFPLVEATKRGQVESVQLLLDNGLKVDIAKGPGKEAYEYAKSHGYVTITRLLRKYCPISITLLRLPSEILSRIVEITVCDDLDIAMYLRVVSKRFDEEIMSAICRTGALEHGNKEILYVSTPFLSRYLFRRTLADRFRNHEYSRVVGITLDYIIRRRPQDIEMRDEYMQMLCYSTIKEGECWAKWSSPHRSSIVPRWLKGKPIERVLAATAMLGLDSLFRDLVQSGVKNRVTCFGEPIRYIAERGVRELVDFLLEPGLESGHEGYRLCKTGQQGAATGGHPALMQFFLDKKADSNYYNSRCLFEWQFYAETLFCAARVGQMQSVEYLVAKLNIMSPNSDRRWRSGSFCWQRNTEPPKVYWYNVAMWEAAEHGQNRVVEWALSHGADVNFGCKCHGTVIDMASMANHVATVKLLLKRGAHKAIDYDGPGSKVFLRALSEGFSDIAKYYTSGYDLNQELKPKRRSGTTAFPIVAAVQRGRVESLEILIAEGLKVDIKSHPGREAYEYAMSRGFTSIARLLREHSKGASVG